MPRFYPCSLVLPALGLCLSMPHPSADSTDGGYSSSTDSSEAQQSREEVGRWQNWRGRSGPSWGVRLVVASITRSWTPMLGWAARLRAGPVSASKIAVKDWSSPIEGLGLLLPSPEETPGCSSSHRMQPQPLCFLWEQLRIGLPLRQA